MDPGTSRSRESLQLLSYMIPTSVESVVYKASFCTRAWINGRCPEEGFSSQSCSCDGAVPRWLEEMHPETKPNVWEQPKGNTVEAHLRTASGNKVVP